MHCNFNCKLLIDSAFSPAFQLPAQCSATALVAFGLVALGLVAFAFWLSGFGLSSLVAFGLVALGLVAFAFWLSSFCLLA